MKDWHNNVDDYLKGLLNEEDEKDFEEELKKNEKLQEDLELSKALKNHFKFQQVKQTINQAKLENEHETSNQKFQQVSQTIQQAKNENIKSRRKRIQLYSSLSMAAMFCLALGITLKFTNTNAAEPFLTNIIVKKAEIENVAAFKIARIDSLVALTNIALHDKKFDPVLALTDQLRNDEEYETDEILQNECYIYFKRQNYTKANRKVDGILDLELKNKIRWKLSLGYISVKEHELAKEQLLKIQEGPYKKKASNKLEKMNY